jgi:hypothetical protein
MISRYVYDVDEVTLACMFYSRCEFWSSICGPFARLQPWSMDSASFLDTVSALLHTDTAPMSAQVFVDYESISVFWPMRVKHANDKSGKSPPHSTSSRFACNKAKIFGNLRVP